MKPFINLGGGSRLIGIVVVISIIIGIWANVINIKEQYEKSQKPLIDSIPKQRMKDNDKSKLVEKRSKISKKNKSSEAKGEIKSVPLSINRYIDNIRNVVAYLKGSAFENAKMEINSIPIREFEEFYKKKIVDAKAFIEGKCYDKAEETLVNLLKNLESAQSNSQHESSDKYYLSK